MAHFLAELPAAFLRATAMLALAAIVLQSIIWILRPNSASLQRALWLFVLVQGVLLVRLPIEIAWSSAPITAARPNVAAPSTIQPAETSPPQLAISMEPESAASNGVAQNLEQPAAIGHQTVAVTQWNWWRITLGVWIGGLLAIAAFIIWGYVGFVRRAVGIENANMQWLAEWNDVLSHAGATRHPRFMVTQDLGPALCLLPSGYVVAVPAATWGSLTAEQRRAVLRHELAHYQNGDLWQSAIALAVCLLHWFNPFAWWALARFHTCGEWRCDELAVETSDRREFARALLQLGGTELIPSTLSQAGSGGGLFLRIKRLLLPETRRDPVTKKVVLTVSALLLLGLGALQFRLVESDSQAADLKTIRDGDTTARVDVAGDPIPAGAVLRLGSVRFRHGSGIGRLEFSRDGRQLVSVANESIRFWQVPGGELLRELRSASQQIETFALSPDGREIAVIGFPARSEGTPPKVTVDFPKQIIEFYSLETLKPISKTTWQENSGLPCMHTVYFPDGKSLLTGSSDGTVRVWERATGKLRIENRLLDSRSSQYIIASLAVSSDGNVIAADDGHILKLWKWQTQEQPLEIKIPARMSMEISFSPDGKLIAVGSYSKKECGVFLFDTATGSLAKKLMALPLTQFASSPVFTSDGKGVVARIEPPEITVMWDVETGEIVKRFSGVIGRPILSPDNKWLARAESSGGAIKLFDFKSGQPVIPLQGASNSGIIQGIHFLPQSDDIITTSDDGTVRRWDGKTGNQTKLLGQHEKWIRALALSPDGKLIATSSLDNTVRIWDTETDREIHKLPGHGDTGGFRALAFTADGKRLASWGDDMDVRIWKVADGRLINEFELHPEGSNLPKKGDPEARDKRYRETKGGLSRAAFSPKATPFVLDYGGALHIYDVETGKELGQTHSGSSIAVSPDGKLLVCSNGGGLERVRNDDGSVTTTKADKHYVSLRELANGNTLEDIELPGNSAGQVAFSQDGKMFAESSGNTPNTIRVWDTSNREEIVRIEGAPATSFWEHSLSFSPDGKRLAVGLKDATVLVWDISRP